MRNCVPCRCRGREVEKESPRDIMNSDFVPRGDPLLTISIIYARFFPHVGGHTHSGYRTYIPFYCRIASGGACYYPLPRSERL